MLFKQDAIFNVQRAALLVAALATGTTSAFPTALEDRMHQPYRAELVPGLEEALRLRAPGPARMRFERRRAIDYRVFRARIRRGVRSRSARFSPFTDARPK